jgi:hypothetical protein
MSQWDPNDPNNPYNQQWQQGQQGQQGHGQSDQQWGQQDQQWQQPQQQWDQGQQQQWQQPQQQQQQWDQGQQQQWDQGQQQQWQQPQQQQPQQQQAYAQGGQEGWDQGGGQQWQQPQQQQGYGGFPGGQQPAYGQAAYQGAYSETFGDTSDSAPGAVATLGVNERVVFLRKTYAHLFGAILLFTALEFLFLWGTTALLTGEGSKSPLFDVVTVPIVKAVFGGSPYLWLVFLGGFIAVGWVAERWAQGDQSKGMQYAGLALYTLAESIIFIPLLFQAQLYQLEFGSPINIIGVSAIITLALFAGLTATVFITKKDFSFMRGALTVGAMAAMGIIVASIVFGFSLGIVFSGAMLLLAGGYVLYYTSGVLHHYRPNQYVAASLALFSAVALMFWYVVRIVMELTSR